MKTSTWLRHSAAVSCFRSHLSWAIEETICKRPLRGRNCKKCLNPIARLVLRLSSLHDAKHVHMSCSGTHQSVMCCIPQDPVAVRLHASTKSLACSITLMKRLQQCCKSSALRYAKYANPQFYPTSSRLRNGATLGSEWSAEIS
eukprot:5483927-Amphidinium_carterae.1